MLFERQRRLLGFLDALGGEVTSLDFQKLLFLYFVEVEDHPTYDFVPYRFGGLSLTSYDDRRKLVQQGFLEGGAPGWRLTPSGRQAACLRPEIRVRMDEFANRHANLRGNILIAEAYRRHPFYAIRSEIARRVLSDDPLALLAIEAVRPRRQVPGLATIGYEGRSLEAYLNALLRASVTLLCDVRRNAFSRKYGFSKATLLNACEGVGIRYEHLPELGIPSQERRELNTQDDYDRLFAKYAAETLPRQSGALEKIYSWTSAGHRVALTCFERQPQQCHRHCVSEELARRWGDALAARHL